MIWGLRDEITFRQAEDDFSRKVVHQLYLSYFDLDLLSQNRLEVKQSIKYNSINY